MSSCIIFSFCAHSVRSRKAKSIYETQNFSFEVELCPLGKNPVTILLSFPLTQPFATWLWATGKILRL